MAVWDLSVVSLSMIFGWNGGRLCMGLALLLVLLSPLLTSSPSPQPLPRQGGGACQSRLRGTSPSVAPIRPQAESTNAGDAALQSAGSKPLPPGGGGVGERGKTRSKGLRVFAQPPHDEYLRAPTLCAAGCRGSSSATDESLARLANGRAPSRSRNRDVVSHRLRR